MREHCWVFVWCRREAKPRSVCYVFCLSNTAFCQSMREHNSIAASGFGTIRWRPVTDIGADRKQAEKHIHAVLPNKRVSVRVELQRSAQCLGCCVLDFWRPALLFCGCKALQKQLPQVRLHATQISYCDADSIYSTYTMSRYIPVLQFCHPPYFSHSRLPMVSSKYVRQPASCASGAA